VKTATALGLVFVLLFVFACPAAAHHLESVDPEPDHVLYGLALILYPFGDIINHLLFGPHEKAESSDQASGEHEPKKPKYNFSPRKKHPQETIEEAL